MHKKETTKETFGVLFCTRISCVKREITLIFLHVKEFTKQGKSLILHLSAVYVHVLYVRCSIKKKTCIIYMYLNILVEGSPDVKCAGNGIRQYRISCNFRDDLFFKSQNIEYTKIISCIIFYKKLFKSQKLTDTN